MPGRYEVELEPEVRSWLDSLPLEQYAKTEAMADLLAERAGTLGEPYARHLGGKVRELRSASCGFTCTAVRCGSATGWHRASGWYC